MKLKYQEKEIEAKLLPIIKQKVDEATEEELEEALRIIDKQLVKKDKPDGSNEVYLETQSGAGEESKEEYMPVTMDNQPTGLKTLKDFDFQRDISDFPTLGKDESLYPELVDKEDLRQGAIKDIENLRKLEKGEIIRFNGFGISGGDEAEAVVGYIMWKNNLKEEELA